MGRCFCFCLVLGVAALSGCEKSADIVKTGKVGETMYIVSDVFEANDFIPSKYTGEAEDVSIPLKWGNVPEGVKSFALICDDPDAPMGIWVHWIIFNIPATSKNLPENIPAIKELPDGSGQGVNDFGRIGYGGPMPPRGSKHRYFFKIYALDCILALKAGVVKEDLLKAMKGHIVAESQVVGLYQR